MIRPEIKALVREHHRNMPPGAVANLKYKLYVSTLIVDLERRLSNALDEVEGKGGLQLVEGSEP